MNWWCINQKTPPKPRSGTCCRDGGDVIACHTSYGYSGRGTSVSVSTKPPRSGMPSGGNTKCLPRYEKDSFSKAVMITSMHSSITSRFI
ncbi:unannotated protein [freshwater metagenome]|uniref:Unannotated protein n=1 Tax=freshwater metagenome TaxID=449393 RepID=A0A6J6YF91_9ZZZZ